MTASANADYFRKLVTDPSGTVDALIPASEVEYVPGGALVSTNVQAALDELEGLSGGGSGLSQAQVLARSFVGC